jgi:hypothetical protein
LPYILIIGIAVSYFIGWLPPSWAVASLLVLVLLTPKRRSAGQPPRRGGYLPRQQSASDCGNQGMVERVQTYTESSPTSGSVLGVREAFTQPRDMSRITALTSYGDGTGGNPGHPTTGVDAS